MDKIKLDTILSFLKSFELKQMTLNEKVNSVVNFFNQILSDDDDDNECKKVNFIKDQLVLAFSKQRRYSSEIVL